MQRRTCQISQASWSWRCAHSSTSHGRRCGLRFSGIHCAVVIHCVRKATYDMQPEMRLDLDENQAPGLGPHGEPAEARLWVVLAVHRRGEIG